MDDRPPNRIACLFPGVKRKLRSVPAEVTVCLRDFPPAMMVPHESRRNTRPGPRCRIFFRPQSLRHCGDARPASALRSSPPAAELAGSFSSLGAWNFHRALPAGIPCGQNPLLRYVLGRHPHVHSSASRCSARFRRRRGSPPEWRWGAALLAGGVALTSHGTKASARAAVNASPEPFSNWILSFGEDLLAVWLTWMATTHPFATIIIAAVLVALCAFLLYYLFRFARRALQRFFAT